MAVDVEHGHVHQVV